MKEKDIRKRKGKRERAYRTGFISVQYILLMYHFFSESFYRSLFIEGHDSGEADSTFVCARVMTFKSESK